MSKIDITKTDLVWPGKYNVVFQSGWCWSTRLSDA